MCPAGKEHGARTFTPLRLFMKLLSVVQLDEQEGLEPGLVVIDPLQLLDLQVELGDILLLAVPHGPHPGCGLQPGEGAGVSIGNTALLPEIPLQGCSPVLSPQRILGVEQSPSLLNNSSCKL